MGLILRLLLTLILIFCFTLSSPGRAGNDGQDELTLVAANADGDSEKCRIVGTIPVTEVQTYFHLGDKLYFADEKRNLWLVEQETIDIFSGEDCPLPVPYDE